MVLRVFVTRNTQLGANHFYGTCRTLVEYETATYDARVPHPQSVVVGIPSMHAEDHIKRSTESIFIQENTVMFDAPNSLWRSSRCLEC